MIAINKTVKAHDSLGMISKVLELSKIAPPSDYDFHPVSRILKGEGRKEYQQKYRELPLSTPPKRRVMGLSCKSFNNHAAYVSALKKEITHIDNEKHREFVRNQLNGGFAFDSENVFV